MNKFILYFRQALHMMKEERLFSAIYIAGTALAVAFTMVIVMAYNFRIAPVYPEVNRGKTCYLNGIVCVDEDSGQKMESASVSLMIVNKLKELKSVEAVGTMLNYQPENYVQKPDGNDEPIYMQFVDDGFFRVYQFDFVEGRPFTHEEWESNQKMMVLTDVMARKVFGKTEELVGKTISVDYESYTICGVVKTANVLSFMSYADAYTCDHSRGYWDLPWGRGSFKVVVLAEDADALKRDFRQMCKTLTLEFKSRGETWGEIEPRNGGFMTHQEMSLSTGYYADDFQSNFIYLILTFVALLIVPVVNLSGIISGRMESRLSEMGVRKAFGAGKAELMLQILTENFVLTLTGSLLGLLLAWGVVEFGDLWMLDALGFSHSTDVNMKDFMATGEMLFAPVVFVAALFFCLLINTLAAFLPTWLSLKKTIVESMMEKR